MGDKYAVNNDSAGKVASDTRALLPDLETVKTTVTGPLSDAEGALPPEFANALSLLKTLRENHERDLKTIKTYATSCVDGLDACLAIYEDSSAQMVAEQKATEAKVTFEHAGLLDSTTKGLNDKIDKGIQKDVNDRMPTKDPGQGGWGKGLEHVNNSEEKSTTRTSTSTSNGVTTTTASKGTSGIPVSTTTTESTSSFSERLKVEQTTTGSGNTTTTDTYYRAGRKPEVISR